MKRDKMRIFAWVLVAFGLIVGGLTIPVGQAMCEIKLRAWSSAPYRPVPDCSFAGGVLVAFVFLGFGILILAIRRPVPRAEVQKPQRVRNAVAAVKNFVVEPDQPLPKATAVTPPPWEQRSP